jgi:four helix bundle protein
MDIVALPFVFEKLEIYQKSLDLVEGNGRFTVADRKNFLAISRGSSQECVPLATLGLRRSLITDAGHSQFQSEREVNGKILSGLTGALANRESGRGY